MRGPFGGYVSTFLTRALIAAVGDAERLPRSLTVQFLAALRAGPVEVAATVERAGRSATVASLRMEQDGAPVAIALGAAAKWRDGDPAWADAEPPIAAPPEAASPLGRDGPMPPFFDHFDVRWVDGGAPGRPSPTGRNVAWLRPRGGGPLDHLAVTAMSDGWMPAAFSKLGRFADVPTLDLTIHFRAPLPVADEWALAVYSTRFSAGGTWEEDGELWTPGGTLLAQSRQLAMIRDRA